MADENEKTEIVVPAPENRTQEDLTPVAVSQSSDETTATPTTTGIASQTENADPTKEELDRRAQSGKMSALERERNALAAQQEKVLKNMNPIFEKNPEVYETWRQGIIADGLGDPGSHTELYGGGGYNPQPQQPTGYQAPNAPAYNPMSDPRYLERVVDQRYEDRKGWEEFITDVPEMDPKNLNTPEERMKAKESWDKLSWFATVYKAQFPNLSSGEVFKMAYRALPENLDRSFEKGREVGELTGRQSAYTAGTGNSSISNARPSTGNDNISVKMTKYELERYEMLKRKNPKVAEYFAQSFAN